MNPRLIHVQYEQPHKLILTFTNNEVREFDFSSYLQYPVYQPLKDEGYCSKATIMNGTVVWDNELDFDPDTLYLDSTILVI